LWEIPAVADYVRAFALESGVHDWRGALFKALANETKLVLIQCRALDEPHPYRVELTDD
jgi:hypothetical protein